MTTNAQAIEEPAREDGSEDEEARTLAEWVTLIISTAILAGAFIVVTYLYVVGDGDPILIRIEVQLDQIRVSEETFYVPIEVFNDGDSAAGTVEIQAELRVGEDIETSQFSIMTLPGDGSETGVVAFSRDPRDGEFTVRVASYTD